MAMSWQISDVLQDSVQVRERVGSAFARLVDLEGWSRRFRRGW